jgi:hypothetical protein
VAGRFSRVLFTANRDLGMQEGSRVPGNRKKGENGNASPAFPKTAKRAKMVTQEGSRVPGNREKGENGYARGIQHTRKRQ